MSKAIDFNREPDSSTIEVQDIYSGWMLSPELEATRPLAQFAP
jgi:hypothetical protein